jgi:hypothetical protein
VSQNRCKMNIEEENELYGTLLMGFVHDIDEIIPRTMIRLPRVLFCALATESNKKGTISKATYQIKWFDGIEYRNLLHLNNDSIDDIQTFTICITETDEKPRKRKAMGYSNGLERETIKATIQILTMGLSNQQSILNQATLISDANGCFFTDDNILKITEVKDFIRGLNFEIFDKDVDKVWNDIPDMISTEPEEEKQAILEYANELNSCLNANLGLLEASSISNTLDHWTVMNKDEHFEGILDLSNAKIASMVPGYEMHDMLKIMISETQTFARLFLKSDSAEYVAKSYIVPKNCKYLEHYSQSSSTENGERKKNLKTFIKDLSFISRNEIQFEEDTTSRGSNSYEAFTAPGKDMKFRLDLHNNSSSIRNMLVTNEVISWTTKKRSLPDDRTECYYTKNAHSSIIYPIRENSMLYVKYIQKQTLVMYRIYIIDNHFIAKASDMINGIDETIESLVQNFIKKEYIKVTGPWMDTQFSLKELDAITDRLMLLT